jgi:hypothetical protein
MAALRLLTIEILPELPDNPGKQRGIDAISTLATPRPGNTAQRSTARKRPSSQVSNNRHRHQWTPVDASGHSRTDHHRYVTCFNDRERARHREFASRRFARERGAATDAATSPPSSACWNRSQTVDLRQRPLATIVQRVHTEEITFT